MWFGVLGPLLVRHDDAVVTVAGPRLRVLLAALLVRAGTAVPADTLAELVWDGAPPATAAVSLRSHVMRLRRALGPGAGPRVITRHPGYLIEAKEEEVDLLRFTRLCRDGGAALRADKVVQASRTLGEALSLWRGAPLADIPCELLHQDEVPGLERQRLQAVESLMEARLRLGDHSELVPELQSLAARHPLQERFHAQLMLALYRSGRQAEALAAYQQARGTLCEELGTEPGPELREMHEQMLAGEPGLAMPALGWAGRAEPATPQQLPAPVPHFVGRAIDLAKLNRLLGDASAGAVVISAVGGTAGVGKTALAVAWARQVAKRFPGGQLYVNLRGYDPGQPMPANDALAGFLQALGVPGPDIPAELDQRAAAYRSLLAGRRVLIVLDNAGSAEQVRPLLPGSPTCAVVVTSRDSLAGLVARDGATRLDLGPLPPREAADLLRTLIGRRADDDPRALATMAAQCSRLPLALRVAAELAIARPAVPLAELTRELGDQQRRLDLLDAGGDPRAAARAVFSWSYRHLGADAAHAFRRLSLHPGIDLDRYAAAALTGSTPGDAHRLLDRLAHAYLVQPAQHGRYGMHDLLRAYARELGSTLDPEEERHTALSRLFDYYLHAAAGAMDTLYPAERDRRPPVPWVPAHAPPVADEASARAWLDAERASLAAVAAYTARHGWADHASRLAGILFRYLDTGGHHLEAIKVYLHARKAARQAGDDAAEATALTGLGVVAARQGRDQQAAQYLRQALSLRNASGNRAGQAVTLANLGIVDVLRGCYEDATEHLRQALTLAQESGDRGSQARALTNLSLVERRQGRHRLAGEHSRQALTLARGTGNRVSEAYALAGLGEAESQLGHFQQAAGHLQQALAVFRETGERAGEGHTLTVLGDTHARQGHHQQATTHLQQALAIHRQIRDRRGEAEVLNSLGEACLAADNPGQARAHYTAAAGLARRADDRYNLARAHDGLARAYQGTGDADHARQNCQRALTLYTALGIPDADRVRAHLATLGR